VLGTGHLGSRHAERLSEAEGFDLVAVHDREADRAAALADRLGTRAEPDAGVAIAAAEAVVVASSTSSHHELSLRALEAGRPVLVEKPITSTVAEAGELVEAAAVRKLVLQVGHVERFNPALRGLWGRLPVPYFIESHRLASLVPRNLDIDVVQDLMVHDLDLVLALVGEDPSAVDAIGVPVITGRVDIANARLRFPGGTVANLTASRVSVERVRKFRMFLPGTYVSADCAAGTGTVYRLKDGREEAFAEALRAGRPLEMGALLERETTGGEGPDALSAEHEAFRLAVRGEPNRGVTGAEALRTLKVLVAVGTAIEDGLRKL
jgi:predicted dehydrogenase